MLACGHFGSSIDAAGACGNDRHCNQIAASAHYKSGRHIASAMGKRGGQAPVSKGPAAKMCSQPRASSGVGANNGSVEDASGLPSGDNALGAAVTIRAAAKMRAAERATFQSRSQLEASATSLGVAHRDGKTRKTRIQIEEDCRLALQAQQSQVQQEGRRSGYALGAAVAKSPALSLGQLLAKATSLGVSHRDESNRQKTRAQLKEDCRLALEAQQFEVQQEARRSGSELDVGGASFGGASSLSAAPAFGRDAERTTTVPGYASVAELSALNLGDLRSTATSLGVARRDESNRQRCHHCWVNTHGPHRNRKRESNLKQNERRRLHHQCFAVLTAEFGSDWDKSSQGLATRFRRIDAEYHQHTTCVCVAGAVWFVRLGLFGTSCTTIELGLTRHIWKTSPTPHPPCP